MKKSDPVLERGGEKTPCPASATHGAVAAAGLAAFLLGVVILRAGRLFGDHVVSSALFLIGVTTGAIFLVDIFWQKVHCRPSTGMGPSIYDPSWRRSLTKFAGLLASMGFVAFFYWLFPEYHGAYYDHYYAMLRAVLPPWLLLALPYFYLIDSRMQKPHDGYWHMGKLATFHWGEMDRRALVQHLLGWLIKGFFLPLMFTYMCDDLGKLIAYDFTLLTSPKPWFDFLYDSFCLIDVGLMSLGYMMTLRLTDTHFRSAEPTMLGWVVALVCYEPFLSLTSRQYLAYETGHTWGTLPWNMPVLYGIWGATILALTATCVWATASFGARFSNLTHRGIITNGPYRWTKHPAYIAKNLSWWIISFPFMAQGTPDETLRHCLLLLGVNAIYMMRAKTEEWHLSRDQDYVNYAKWIEAHGVFRWIQRVPVIRHLAYQ